MLIVKFMLAAAVLAAILRILEEVSRTRAMKKPAGKDVIELFVSADGWRWRIRAANGQILLTSESYHSKASMMRTVDRFQYNHGGFEVREDA